MSAEEYGLIFAAFDKWVSLEPLCVPVGELFAAFKRGWTQEKYEDILSYHK